MVHKCGCGALFPAYRVNKSAIVTWNINFETIVQSNYKADLIQPSRDHNRGTPARIHLRITQTLERDALVQKKTTDVARIELAVDPGCSLLFFS
jgi:hypothetical protein